MIDMQRLVGRNPHMRKTTIVLLTALFSLLQLPGCGGDKANDKTAQQATGEESAAEEASESTATEPEKASAPETVANSEEKATTAPANAAASTEPVPRDRLEINGLPKPNSDGFFMMMQQATNSCRPDDSECAPVRQLAARIPNDLEEISKLAKSGTDQQKTAIRRALLLTDHEPAFPLLLSFAMNKQGRLDMPVVEHAIELRASALVAVLRKFLEKAVGSDAKEAIIAIGRVGGDSARQALKDALTLTNAKPFLGDVCQALARTGAIDTKPAVQALGSRLDGSRRQREGCRNAEAAFGMLKLPGAATLFLDGKQYQRVGVVAEQRAERSITLIFSDTADPSCKNRGNALVEVDVPLSWDGAPIIGKPVVSTVRVGADELAADTAYYTRLDSLELKIGNSFQGIGFFSYVPSKGKHRLVMGGTFKGTYCGTLPK